MNVLEKKHQCVLYCRSDSFVQTSAAFGRNDDFSLSRLEISQVLKFIGCFLYETVAQVLKRKAKIGKVT